MRDEHVVYDDGEIKVTRYYTGDVKDAENQDTNVVISGGKVHVSRSKGAGVTVTEIDELGCLPRFVLAYTLGLVAVTAAGLFFLGANECNDKYSSDYSGSHLERSISEMGAAKAIDSIVR